MVERLVDRNSGWPLGTPQPIPRIPEATAPPRGAAARFPAPRRADKVPGGYVVRDANSCWGRWIASPPDWNAALVPNGPATLFTLKFVAFASPSLSANRPFGHLKGILKPNKIFRR
jgi:hypothetical protein